MSQAISVCHGEFGRAAMYQLNKTIITHAHREGHLVFYVDGDDANCTAGSTHCPVDTDHAAAVSPWEPHCYNVGDGKTQICLVLYIKPMWFLENSSSAEFALKFGRSDLKLNHEIKGFLNQLTCLLLDHEEEIRFDSLLFGLTKACFDASWEDTDRDYRGQIYNRFSDYRVRRSLRLIQDNMGEDLEMEELARKVGLSRPHFFKLFKQYTGVTPNVYMNTLRSERAIEELLNSDKTVTDIAFDLGFSSQASFTRFFSSNVGIAPSEYRRVAHVSNGAFPMM